MINKLELMDMVEEELRLDAQTLISKLPLVPIKFEIINGRKVSVYEKNKVLKALKKRKSREGSTALRIKIEMIKVLGNEQR